jgi:hypothetical protein
MADSLDAACSALVGKKIRKLSTKRLTPGATAPSITSSDCAAVRKMEQAVQLRKAPTQCNFQPLLAKNPPAACGRGFDTRKVWGEDFEDGLAGWRKAGRVAFEGGHGLPWRARKSAPAHRSRVAYAPATDAGQCTGGVGDISSVDALASPTVVLPRGAARRLVFQHNVATEAGYDGGNVRIKIGDGAWQLVPDEAWLFNAPNTTLATGDEGNTNPMAGEPAFTGTDGGQVHGSWGTSIVDLDAAGAHAGDEVRFRFDMGRDGCGGVDGWYLDSVRVLACTKHHHGKAAVGTRQRATRR